MRDIYHDLVSAISLKFQALTAAADGDNVIDLQGFEGALIQIFSGTITDGTSYEFELKECDTSGGTYTAVVDADLIGSEPTFLAANDDVVNAFGYIGKKRYLRIDLKTVVGSPSTGGVFGGVVVKGLPRHAPGN